MNGRRVLLLCEDRGVPAEGPSGASAHLRGVARALAAAGYEVSLATPPADARGAQLEALPVERRPLDDLGRPDWIWERLCVEGHRGPALQRRFDLPRLLEVNAPVVAERQRVARVTADDTRREAHALATATRVIAVSRWLGRWCAARGARAVRVVPNGTDALRPGDRTGTRARLGVEGPLACFIGAGRPWQGVTELADVLDAAPDWSLLVLGDAVVRHPRARLLGRAPRGVLPDLLAAADAGLAPMPADAPPWLCPLKACDYRAQGVPVVGRAVADLDPDIAVEGTGSAAWVPALDAARATPRRPRPRSWAQVVADALAPDGYTSGMVALLLLLLAGCKNPFADDDPPRDCATRSAFYPDSDGDGIGEPTAVFVGCTAPDGWVSSVTTPPTDTGGSGATGPTPTDTGPTGTGSGGSGGSGARLP